MPTELLTATSVENSIEQQTRSSASTTHLMSATSLGHCVPRLGDALALAPAVPHSPSPLEAAAFCMGQCDLKQRLSKQRSLLRTESERCRLDWNKQSSPPSKPQVCARNGSPSSGEFAANG